MKKMKQEMVHKWDPDLVQWQDDPSDEEYISSISEKAADYYMKKYGYKILMHYISSLFPGKMFQDPGLVGDHYDDLEYVEDISVYSSRKKKPSIIVPMLRPLELPRDRNLPSREVLEKLLADEKFMPKFMKMYRNMAWDVHFSVKYDIKTSMLKNYHEVLKWRKFMKGDFDDFTGRDSVYNGMLHVPLRNLSELTKLENELSDLMDTDVYTDFFLTLNKMRGVPDPDKIVKIPLPTTDSELVVVDDAIDVTSRVEDDDMPGKYRDFDDSDLLPILSQKDRILEAVDPGLKVLATELFDLMEANIRDLTPPWPPTASSKFVGDDGKEQELYKYSGRFGGLRMKSDGTIDSMDMSFYDWTDDGNVSFRTPYSDEIVVYRLKEKELGDIVFAALNIDSLMKFFRACILYYRTTCSRWVGVHESLVKMQKILDTMKILEG
jgi:hypothetical protein